ncbi:hypothetical protein QG37_04354 [Candidozyma auris]|uniref:Uncharacterized protein n=1 Tax=Candidozyma auris TaxID=498019 RepID=A0A0L0NWQ1_CANAR|nr:hypothetical protein QG37_04354 [[Candida] auris]
MKQLSQGNQLVDVSLHLGERESGTAKSENNQTAILKNEEESESATISTI